MERAVIAIGVRKTGQLPELQAAVQSATNFAEWARTIQKVPKSRVKLITDAKSRVSRDRIFDEVEKITKLGFIEQLIVYFSGHGINSGMYEQWLLSKAPEDPAAAVNVKGSEFGARFCGIGHVVFISDACRTAADSIQAQRVTGGDIFPNVQPTGAEKPVDQFFATLVGNPAYEVKSVKESADRYRAAYSTVLMKALEGEVPSLVEASTTAGLVRPRPLRDYLAVEVPRYFSTLGLAGAVSSQPSARLESDPGAWIAELPLPAATPGATGSVLKRRRVGRSRDAFAMLGDAVLPPLGVEQDLIGDQTLEREVSLELRAVLDPSQPTLLKRRLKRRRRVEDTADKAEARRRFESRVASGRTTFGPDHMESQCGIKVRGARIARAYSRYAQVVVGTRNDVIRVDLPKSRRGANVLVQLADDSVVIAPAYRELMTGLSFDADGNLEDVWCEPSANTTSWAEYEANLGEIRTLRSLVAAASAFGVFRLDNAAEGDALFDRIRGARTVDPALAVYAAHAFNDRRMRSHIIDLQRYLDERLGVRIFDVAMLAFSLGGGASPGKPREMYPCVPMLTQAWALLSPLGIALPGGLGSLLGDLRPALWTHFTPAAADRLQHVLEQGKVG